MENPREKAPRPVLLFADPPQFQRGSILSISQGPTPQNRMLTEDATEVEVVVLVEMETDTVGHTITSVIGDLVNPDVAAAQDIETGVTAGVGEGEVERAIEIALVVLVWLVRRRDPRLL
jgi:hypothetical protein